MSNSASQQSERPFSLPNRTLDDRQERVVQAVATGVAAWQSERAANGLEATLTNGRFAPPNEEDIEINGRFTTPDQPGTMANLPRRRPINVAAKDVEATPPQMRFVTFQTNYRQTLVRVVYWIALLLRFAIGIMADKLRRQDSPERRAVRLRQQIEQRGDTFIKIGQHLGMRIDFIPWHYCAELSRMRDKMAPFATDEAIAKIEQATKRPLADTFTQFDPEPVGSTTLTCVYQAILKKTGQKVVVKVRRPGVGERLMADLVALDLLALAAEFMTFFRPGHTKEMRREFHQTLLEELDFIQEARYQDSFRRAAKKSLKSFFTSPRVYFELCSADVIVEEFVNGIWLWELLAAVEQNNSDVLALADSLNIDPHLVAHRLCWVNFWGWHEHLFFHADPHPDNIIVGPNSTLTFIDFGSIGAVDRTKRQALQQNMYYAWRQDPLNMARASLTLLEPLPRIDLIDFTKELESHNWQMLYAFASRQPHSPQHDRTSATQWLGLIQVARKYGVTIDFHILRLLKATLTYDSLATRLNPELDIIKEYRRFSKDVARRIGRKTRRRLYKQAVDGVDGKVYLRLERWLNAGEGLYFRLRRMLSIPSVNFSMLMSKWSFIMFTTVIFAAEVLLVTGVAMTAVSALHYFSAGELFDARQALLTVATHWLYQLIILFLLIINGRSLLFRLDDKDV